MGYRVRRGKLAGTLIQSVTMSGPTAHGNRVVSFRVLDGPGTDRSMVRRYYARCGENATIIPYSDNDTDRSVVARLVRAGVVDTVIGMIRREGQ